MGAQDWSCNQFRKIGNETRINQEIPFGNDRAPIHVNAVTDGLESIEADSQWQDYVENWFVNLDADKPKRRKPVTYNEKEILEINKEPQIDHEAHVEPAAPMYF